MSQLKRIKSFLNKRDFIAKLYEKFLDVNNLCFQKINRSDFSSRHLFVILVKKKGLRNLLYKYLASKKIQANYHYIPIYHHPLYNISNKFNKMRLKNYERYYEQALSLPIHCNINKKDVFKIIKEINLFFSHVKKNK